MVFRSSVRSNLCEGNSVDCIFSMTNDIVHVTFNDLYHFVRRVLFLLHTILWLYLCGMLFFWGCFCWEIIISHLKRKDKEHK